MELVDVDQPEFHLATLNRLIRDMMNGLLRQHGMKLVEWRVLQCLSEKDALTVFELSALAVIDRTATGRLIDRLVDQGLVRKKQSPNDRRYASVSLSAAGLKKLKACSVDVADASPKLFDGLDQQDISQLLKLLHTLQRNAYEIMYLRDTLQLLRPPAWLESTMDQHVPLAND